MSMLHSERFSSIKRFLNMEFTEEPSGDYPFSGWKADGHIVYVSGHVGMLNGKLPYQGKLGKDITVEEGKKSAALAVLNCLQTIENEIGLDHVEEVIRLTGYVASDPGFYEQPQVMNGGSEVLNEVFEEKGLHARSAIGLAVLPLNASVEVELILKIKV